MSGFTFNNTEVQEYIDEYFTWKYIEGDGFCFYSAVVEGLKASVDSNRAEGVVRYVFILKQSKNHWSLLIPKKWPIPIRFVSTKSPKKSKEEMKNIPVYDVLSGSEDEEVDEVVEEELKEVVDEESIQLSLNILKLRVADSAGIPKDGKELNNKLRMYYYSLGYDEKNKLVPNKTGRVSLQGEPDRGECYYGGTALEQLVSQFYKSCYGVNLKLLFFTPTGNNKWGWALTFKRGERDWCDMNMTAEQSDSEEESEVIDLTKDDDRDDKERLPDPRPLKRRKPSKVHTLKF